jgi:hypothetical protein
MDKYNRSAAVAYALDYALSPNSKYPFFAPKITGGDCTNFLSQCLYAGNCPMSHSSAYPWWINTQKNTWSYSWTIAGSLFACLKGRAKAKLSGVFGIEVESFSLLTFGDTIFYEDNNRKIYHGAIVTSFESDGFRSLPLISQHTINARNITFIKPKAYKSHFVKIYCN